MIGIDIVSIKRIERLIDKFGQKALDRFLSPKEIELSKGKVNSIAGYWATKEAISKALGVGIGSQLNFHDIHLSKTKRGAPKFKLSKRAGETFDIKESSLSITHDGGFAIAVVDIRLKKRKKGQ
jgi:holo-[acyl-carrier protein] synthase